MIKSNVPDLNKASTIGDMLDKITTLSTKVKQYSRSSDYRKSIDKERSELIDQLDGVPHLSHCEKLPGEVDSQIGDEL
jgi:hypothetical protein